MMVIKRVNPMSAAKIQGVLGLIVGLIAGIIMAIFASLLGPLQKASVGPAFGAGAIIFLPVMYGIGGFIAGLIGGCLYNLVAKWVGGIELDLEQKA